MKNNFSKNKKGDYVWLLVLLGLALVGLGAFMAFRTFKSTPSSKPPITEGPGSPQDDLTQPPGTTSRFDISDWEVYENEKYDFRLSYPTDWKVATSAEKAAPMITIYDPETVATYTPPVDHFTDITHVSVYPTGIPTEGETGQTTSSEVTVAGAVAEAKDYILDSGLPWATEIKFSSYPDSWTQYGFLWSRLKLEKLQTKCYRQGEKIEPDRCDPMMRNDVVVRKADVNAKNRDIQEIIFSTFHFTDEGSTFQTNLDDLISLTTPELQGRIESPLLVEGEARGTWFLKGNFPVILQNDQGEILATTSATTSAEWLTSEFIPFTASLSFKKPETATGTLILKKAGISGFHTKPLKKKVPVLFK